METKEYIPFIATHPGSILKDELNFRGISRKEFAQRIGMQTIMLNSIIRGESSINDEVALLLEKGLGIKADSWIRLQEGYELDCERIKTRNILKAL